MIPENKEITFKIGDVVRLTYFKSDKHPIGIILRSTNLAFEVLQIFILSSKNHPYYKIGDTTFLDSQDLSHSLVEEL